SLISGYWNSQAVYVAAKLQLADRLADGPLDAAALAEQTDSHPQALFRLLRALVSLGVFAETADGRFELNAAAELLRPNVPGSQWAMAIMLGEEQYRAWGELLYSVQTGKTSFEKIFDRPVFEYLAEHPEQAAVFDRAMVGIHGRESAAIVDAFDFSTSAAVADIGGGNGSLLSALLERHPNLHGTLFDLPGVIDRAGRAMAQSGLQNRIHLVAGDFFESVPSGADAYMLRHIIHDWDDDRAIRILENVHRSLAGQGRVLVIESVIPPGSDPFFGKLLDLTMLTVAGGQERTQEEYRHLFAEAGFRISQIIPTRTEVSIIEGIPE
ncbi:MAG: methyltransferase, partial [Planctomycetaceae bacterium]|nr:methyltransferase [Planctomycetaceae bacterium]